MGTDKTSDPIRILVADDHPLLLEGIQAQVSRIAGAEIVGHAVTGEEALHLARQLHPDIILMDVSMAGIGGIEATRRLLGAYDSQRVIMLSMHDDAEYVRQSAQAGARGYVLKSSNPALIQQAIETVMAGDVFFDEEIADALLQKGTGAGPGKDPSLAPRERQVLALLAEGLLNKEIADRLCLSVRTVETYRERLMRKLEMRSVAELTRYAVSQDITPLK